MGVGYDVGSVGSGRGRRSMILLEPLDKVQQQRQKRMIKNRESSARSREHKQAYQVKLESMAVRLEEENELLKEKVNAFSFSRVHILLFHVIWVYLSISYSDLV